MTQRGTNGVTNAILLDRVRRQADIAVMSSSARIPFRVIFSVATALSFFSAFAAFYFVSTFGEKSAAFGLLLVLNMGYWYSWAILTPAILWLTGRFPFDRSSWKLSVPVHIAVAERAGRSQAGDVAWVGADVKKRDPQPPDVINLARVYDADERVPHHHQVQVGSGERGRQLVQRLVRYAADIR